MTTVFVCMRHRVDNMQPDESTHRVEEVFLNEADAQAWVEEGMAEYYESDEEFEEAQNDSCRAYVYYTCKKFEAK